MPPYKLASRDFHPDNTIIRVGNVDIGKDVVIIAGPCAIEGVNFVEQAKQLSKMGVNILRGGAYKPRTSPYSFSGLEEEGLEILAEARKQSGLPFVTEITDIRNLDLFCQYVDIIQVGSRNMQNFCLLQELGRISHPVLLKRGYAAKLDEWLLAAEYILAEGNKNVILCERGIRSFETYTRYTFDINAIPAVKTLSHLPIIADPSHGTGRKELVIPVAKAALAAGADGVMVEVHPDPERALSDGGQSLTMNEFKELISFLGRLQCRTIRG
ncbi:3-deoxy-7-phosphoheptulonate synthase [Desulfotruncus alcoholivorax]|uniref:3-deoxy-7-phosphoheptulonate synthase n=1 Tax=Desulfotruncus alcoholivorax TaxID=265477 RepID=UPI00041483F6|nr:3-deoxy-7-phosphoheptulonate synthase [Desulfotruncus alcoholivorax]